ncbi:MAG: hypothetical protein U0002_14055 [Thermoanaerobaculia bacterium]
MAGGHLRPEAVETLVVGGEESSKVVLALFQHLLELCPECRRIWQEESARRRSRDSSRLGPGVVERTLSRLGRQGADLERERLEAPELVRELVQAPEAEQRRLLAEDPRLRTWGVCDLLINESYQAVFDDPATAEALAELALSLAERLDPGHYGGPFLADVQALAWAYLANARRVSTDLRGAAEALRRAEALLEAGVGDPLCRAQVLSFKASLLRARRQGEQSQLLLEEVLGIYERLGDLHMVGYTLIQKAYDYRQRGMAAGAVALLKRAIGQVDPTRDPRLLLCARHNLVDCMIEVERYDEAEELLAAARPDYAHFGPASWPWLLRWTEGRLAAARERFEEAEQALLEARKGFFEQGLGYDTALISLDLAAIYARRGETHRVRELVQEMVPIFRSQDVHREALAALAMFQQAALRESISLGTVLRYARYLRRAKLEPSLGFEGGS